MGSPVGADHRVSILRHHRSSGLSFIHQLTEILKACPSRPPFKGGNLDKLPDELKRYFEQAVRRVRDVEPFCGAKLPIGTI